MDDEVWVSLIHEALNRAACATAACRIIYRTLPWYATYQHIDDAGHDCGICNPAQLPTRIVSAQTLATTKREVLVGRLARFLDHLHQYPTASRPAVDEAPGGIGNGTGPANPVAGTSRPVDHAASPTPGR